MKVKFGLVIQGPFISEGMGAGSLGMTRKANLPKSRVRKVDAGSIVPPMLKEYAGLFDAIVISGWEGDEQITNIPSHAEQVFNSNVNPLFAQYPSTSKWVFAPGWKQFESTRIGIEKLIAQGCTHVIKMRSDQWLDLYSIVSFINKNKNSEQIFVPAIRKDFSVHDFYFGGKIDLLSQYFSQLCKYGSTATVRNIHYDLILKPIAINRSLGGTANRALFPHYGRLGSMPIETLCILRSALTSFSPMPSAIFCSMIWRGETMEEEGKANAIREEYHAGDDFLKALDRYINSRRYDALRDGIIPTFPSTCYASFKAVESICGAGSKPSAKDWLRLLVSQVPAHKLLVKGRSWTPSSGQKESLD